MKKRAPGAADSGPSRVGLAWLSTFLVVAALVLGLMLVWLNIERMDLAYDIRRLETDLNRQKALIAKLEVERGNLVSPQRLRKIAREMGLGPAQAGQIRRVRTEGVEVESTAAPESNRTAE